MLTLSQIKYTDSHVELERSDGTRWRFRHSLPTIEAFLILQLWLSPCACAAKSMCLEHKELLQRLGYGGISGPNGETEPFREGLHTLTCVRCGAPCVGEKIVPDPVCVPCVKQELIAKGLSSAEATKRIADEF
jgi:hypothetical protein